MPDVKGHTLKALAYDNIEMTSDIMTDEFQSYRGLQGHFASHQAVDHSKEYVRGVVHVNFAESYFSLANKARNHRYAFHHISADHLQRYLGEFDFRWNHHARPMLAWRLPLPSKEQAANGSGTATSTAWDISRHRDAGI